MMNNRNYNKRKKAECLFKQGLTQKAIAQKIGITEKTAGKWLKPYKAKEREFKQIEKKLIVRLNSAIKSGKPPRHLKTLAETLKTIRAAK